MRVQRTALPVLLSSALLLAGAVVFGQQKEKVRGYQMETKALGGPSGRRTGPKAGTARDIALQYLHDQKQELGLTAADLGDVVVTSEPVSEHSGVTHVYFQQQFRGIPVNGAVANVNVAFDGSVISAGSSFVGDLTPAIRSGSAARGPSEAAQAAAKDAKLVPTRPFEVLSALGGPTFETILSDGGVAAGPVKVSLVYQAVGPRDVRLGWLVDFEETSAENWWNTVVDAESGEVIFAFNLTDSDHWPSPFVTDAPGEIVIERAPGAANPPAFLEPAPARAEAAVAAQSQPETSSYRVYAMPKESPSDGPRTLELSPYNLLASPWGWHDTNGAIGAEFLHTRGNNVHAYSDIAGSNPTNPPAVPSGGASLAFDFPLDLGLGPLNYTNAAVVNLFYWNNLVHDVFYGYGFTELAGNFQVNNYGRGPTSAPLGANDDVRAEAQDGSGTNNANFSTPADGSRPRMQMFQWTSPFTNAVVPNTGPLVGSQFSAGSAAFGPPLTSTGITADLVIALDAANTDGPSTTDGCTALTNAAQVSGRIAIIDRGTCSFVIKVKNAQNAGAVAVIIANNVAGQPITLGGTDATITIPSGMVSDVDAAVIKANLPFNATFRQIPSINRDSDLDAGIIAHEYGHGISNRLTGGRTVVTCLGNNEQMGEGWSDFIGLVMTAKPWQTRTTVRGVGTYVIWQGLDGRGIRPTAYTTDMAVNPSTYDTIKTAAIPHGVGYVWGTMLWEVFWNLVDKHGFNPDIYGAWNTGGNNLAIQLVTDGMKLQPCSPGFVTGRNAILQADQNLTGGANYCAIWQGFAKRGLGLNASQGSAGSVTDGVQNFELPVSCRAAATVTPGSMSAMLPWGATIANVLTIANTAAVDGQSLDWSIAEAAGACSAPSNLPWVSAAPSSGTTAAAGQSAVSITFDAGTTDVGIYAGRLCVATSSTTTPSFEVPMTLTIIKAAQTIDFGPLPNRTYGDPPFTVTATASSGLPVSFAAAGSCTVAGSTVTITGGGSCTVTASQAGSVNYHPAPDVAQTFGIGQAAQTINFGPLLNRLVGDPPFTVTATASSGLPVSFAAAGSCTVSGSLVTPIGVGPCTITASQPGDTNYAAAPNVSRTFSVVYPVTAAYPPVTSHDLTTGGSSVPVMFGLGGDYGMNILAPGYPMSQQVNCSTQAPLGAATPIENPGGSNLSFNPGTNRYHFNWKTDKAWKDTCRVFILGLNDGTEHRLYFTFR